MTFAFRGDLDGGIPEQFFCFRELVWIFKDQPGLTWLHMLAIFLAFLDDQITPFSKGA